MIASATPHPQPTPPIQLLKIAEVAKRLDVSTRTVWRWVGAGILPGPIRFTQTCVRWRLEDIQAALDRLTRSRDKGFANLDPSDFRR